MLVVIFGVGRVIVIVIIIIITVDSSIIDKSTISSLSMMRRGDWIIFIFIIMQCHTRLFRTDFPCRYARNVVIIVNRRAVIIGVQTQQAAIVKRGEEGDMLKQKQNEKQQTKSEQKEKGAPKTRG